MDKYSPIRLHNQSNRRSSINQKIKTKSPKKYLQQSVLKTKATKSNAIMEKLDDSYETDMDATNINHFAPIFE